MKDATSPTITRADRYTRNAAVDSDQLPAADEYASSREKVGSGQIATILSGSPRELSDKRPRSKPAIR